MNYDSNNEIKNLQEAFSNSPDNEIIRKMLVEKSIGDKRYFIFLESLLKDSIVKYPYDTFYKAALIQIYFNQDKYSACLIIGEEILRTKGIGNQTTLLLAKCYLRLGKKDKSKELYAALITENQDFQDDELDKHLRLNKTIVDINDSDEQLLITSNINFSNVGGMEHVKKEIDLKIIKPLENIDLFKKYGKKVGGGILLYGPPGCGKTFIAKATAGEISANFISVGLNDILDMWLGSSEKKLHNYFELARRNTPCVLFFDEVDALGASRDISRASAGKNIINQFLSEFDGVNSTNEGILIIGATNLPWHLDSAFLRPGRFDRVIFVPPPDYEGKKKILQLNLENKPVDDNINYSQILKNTDMYSGADLVAIVDKAVEKVLEKAINTGIESNITTEHILKAAQKHNPSTSQWFSLIRNHIEFANKSGLYNDVKKYLKM